MNSNDGGRYSIAARIYKLKSAYSPSIYTSGLRLEQSLSRYMITVTRLRRSRVV